MEVRRYDPFTVCSVKPNGSADGKVKAASFGALAGYILGKNEECLKMQFNKPALQHGDGHDHCMAVVLPSKYWDNVGDAPSPLADSGVSVECHDGGDYACVRFSGVASKGDVSKHRELLFAEISKDGGFVVDSDADVVLAQYDPPFVLPWKRTNEVMVKVLSRD